MIVNQNLSLKKNKALTIAIMHPKKKMPMMHPIMLRPIIQAGWTANIRANPDIDEANLSFIEFKYKISKLLK